MIGGHSPRPDWGRRPFSSGNGSCSVNNGRKCVECHYQFATIKQVNSIGFRGESLGRHEFSSIGMMKFLEWLFLKVNVVTGME